MKKSVSILIAVLMLIAMLPNCAMATPVGENGLSWLDSKYPAFFDGDNLPSSKTGLLGKDGGTSVSSESVKGLFGKPADDTFIKVDLVGHAASFIATEWGSDNKQPSDTVWYKDSFDGCVICEADLYCTNGFAEVKVVTDQNQKVSNTVSGLEANKWHHVAFVIDCDGNGGEITQAFVDGIPNGQPCTDGVLGDNRGSAGNFKAKNDLRVHITLNTSSGGVYYADNVHFHEASDPLITCKSAALEEIVDNSKHTIELVDNPDMKASDFINNTAGAAVKKRDGSAPDSDTLLKDCIVSANLAGVYPFDYTFVLARDYAVYNESFNGTLNQTSTGGMIYSSGNVTFKGDTGNAGNITFKKDFGLGGKPDTDGSAVICASNTTKAAAPMIYISENPYYSDKALDKTFTVEAKLLVSGMNGNVNSADVYVTGKHIVSFSADGNVISGQTSENITNVTGAWSQNKWIPVAVTYHKAAFAENYKMDVYVLKHKVLEGYACGEPSKQTIEFGLDCNAAGTAALAIDDFRLYSGSLEKYTYIIGQNRDSITFLPSESIAAIPILVRHNSDGYITSVAAGNENTVSMNYGDGDIVEAFLWKDWDSLQPMTEKITLVDPAVKISAYNAKFSTAFGDDMVIQSGLPIAVWGMADGADGSAVEVSLGDKTEFAYINNGIWETEFPAMEVNEESAELSVTSLTGTQTIHNILFGDVYYVAGQSNAYFQFSRTDTYSADRSSFKDSDNIRIFHQVGTYQDEVQINPVEGSCWEKANSSTAGKMSAVGMYFAKTLRDNGVTVPIGLISVAHDGTSLHYDIPTCITDKYTIDYLPDRVNKSYNAMLAPVEKFAAKGMIWFQGENDSIDKLMYLVVENYNDMFKEFVDYMKTVSRSPDMKVFMIQLSSYSIDSKNPSGTPNETLGWNIPRFRCYQYDLASEMDNVYIIPSLDYGFRKGDPDPAHPVYKKPIGERTGKAALYAIYGKLTENNALAPIPAEFSYKNGTVTIKFKNIGSALLCDSDVLRGFEIIDEAGAAVSATATIIGTDTVKVEADVTEAKGVRYGFYQSAPATVAGLRNSNGIACVTFANDKGSDNGFNAAAVKSLSLGAMQSK